MGAPLIQQDPYRIARDGVLPLQRMRWVNNGESFSAGDRTLHAVCPPTWDGSNTRGLFDPTSGVYWAADSFASFMTRPVANAAELDHDFWVGSFRHENCLAVGWHSLLDPTKFDAHVDQSARLQPAVIASAHGPVLTGHYIHEGYQMTRQLARLEPVDQPGQAILDQMVAAIAAA